MSTLLGQIFGSGGAVAVAFAFVYGLFEAVDRNASKSAQAELAAYLKSTDYQMLIERFPISAATIFSRIFGPRHFSWHCFSRSVLFSVLAIGSLLTIAAFHNWRAFYDEFRVFWITSQDPSFAKMDREVWYGYVYLVGWSLIADYVSLFKSRVVISFFSTRSVHARLFLAIIFADFLFSLGVFGLGGQIMFGLATITVDPAHGLSNLSAGWYFELVQAIFVKSELAPSVFFWAGMVPSLWIWAAVIGSLLTRFALKSAPLLFFIGRRLNLEDHAVRSVGFVVAITVSATYGAFLAIRDLLAAV